MSTIRNFIFSHTRGIMVVMQFVLIHINDHSKKLCIDNIDNNNNNMLLKPSHAIIYSIILLLFVDFKRIIQDVFSVFVHKVVTD